MSEQQQKILNIVKEKPEGATQSEIAKGLSEKDGGEPDDHSEVVLECINLLLKSGNLEAFHLAGEVIFKAQDPELAEKLQGLSPEAHSAYQAIKKAGDQGIWRKELKKILKIAQDAKLDKVIKTLNTRTLIKQVKGATGGKKNKILYMLYHLEPAAELSGGPWYNAEGAYNTELINSLKHCVHNFVLEKGKDTLTVEFADIAKVIKGAGLSEKDLSDEHIQNIVDVLVFDGKLEEQTVAGSLRKKYRAQRLEIEITPLTTMPCGVCPVFQRCTPGGVISPESCKYMDEWLSF